MRVHSYTIVHYGKDYIGYALQSVHDQMDQVHIVYTPYPTHGHQTEHKPPENGGEILEAVLEHDPEQKVQWHEVHHVRHEGPHRDLAVGACQNAGAEMVLVVDCDEVWNRKTLKSALAYAWDQNKARNWLINFTHLWRSFDWCCRDEGWPVRILDLRHFGGTAYIPRELGEIYHFGYATTSSLMWYKWQIHGHKNELRPEWWKERWMKWPPVGDCHPTNRDGFWNPEPFDKAKLPELMRSHPFYDLERIE